jgi:hypothetical protein
MAGEGEKQRAKKNGRGEKEIACEGERKRAKKNGRGENFLRSLSLAFAFLPLNSACYAG